MTEQEAKIKNIILEYCQGINHLEFDLEYLPEMVSRLAALKNLPSSQPIIESRHQPIPKERWGVHRTHCCSKHGCKYGDKYCPVATGELKQDYPCEDCQYDDSI